MLSRTLFSAVVAVIAAGGFVATDRTLAAEPHSAGMKVISSDETARFMALGISKSVVIDLPTDIKEVLVADPSIVKAVVQSTRRVFILGAGIGQTNVYFFGANGRQIEGLNIAVALESQQGALEKDDLSPANMVMIYFGPLVDQKGGSGSISGSPYGFFASLSCTSTRCIDAHKPGSDQPPGTQNVNITGSGAGGASVSVGK